MKSSATSLRRRLLALLLSALAGVGVLLAIATYYDTHRALDQLLDAQLAQSARLLTQQAGHELLELEPLENSGVESYAQKFAVQVWNRQGELVVLSAGAPNQRFSTIERGFSDATIQGEEWRVFSDWDIDGQALVQVAELHNTRNELAMRVALNSIWPLLLALPVIGVLSWWLIGAGLRPLTRIGAQVSSRDPRNLEPLATDALPNEVRPLVERLNELFARIVLSLEGERRFTADAAHELRNPVAAIRAQAEAALTSTLPGAQHDAFKNIVASAERLARIVDQLLMLARLDVQSTAPPLQRLEIVSLVRATLAELAPDLLAQGVDLELEAPESLAVKGDAALLQVVVRNLIDNAAKHAGASPKIWVRVEAKEGDVALNVADNGPGISEQDRAQLSRRFYRGAAAQGIGSGLGLSIVARIAQLHGGTLEAGSRHNGKGAVVVVRWPISAGSKSS